MASGPPAKYRRTPRHAYLALDILGATVMHNLDLHSGILQTRVGGDARRADRDGGVL